MNKAWGSKKRSAEWWAVFGALLAASAVPCPECGGPLALHLWPLIALLIAARAIAGRARPSQNDKKTTQGTLSDLDAAKMEQGEGRCRTRRLT
jgi:hypothetical protein